MQPARGFARRPPSWRRAIRAIQLFCPRSRPQPATAGQGGRSASAGGRLRGGRSRSGEPTPTRAAFVCIRADWICGRLARALESAGGRADGRFCRVQVARCQPGRRVGQAHAGRRGARRWRATFTRLWRPGRRPASERASERAQRRAARRTLARRSGATGCRRPARSINADHQRLPAKPPAELTARADLRPALVGRARRHIQVQAAIILARLIMNPRANTTAGRTNESAVRSNSQRHYLSRCRAFSPRARVEAS